MARRPALDKFHNFFFGEIPANVKLTESEQKIITRYRAIFLFHLERPHVTEKETVNFLVNNFNISKSKAYEDLNNVKVLLGDVQNAHKNWIRYAITQTLLGIINDIQNPPPGKKQMSKAKGIILIIRACATLGKLYRLDQEDPFIYDWDEIKPQTIEPTSDPTCLGVKPIPNRREFIKQLYEKYREDIDELDINQWPASSGGRSE